MENNKSYRINTKIGEDVEDISINLNILQNYDILEILSLQIGTESLYKLHTSDYGCLVGRVLANGGVGIPNAKISVFIEANSKTKADDILSSLYPYERTDSKDGNNIRYNLLPIEQISECHQAIGTLPNKRLVLDDKHVLEIFETYYKFTTTTNESGDYMLFGLPKGNQTIHMDLDLSDIGFLSQKPIDMMYKGYTKTSFENSMQFKVDTNLDNLVQIVSQNASVYIKPFWGEDELEEVGITRHDIDVNYKFEPTCIFIGSLITEEKSAGFSKRCVPTREMGRMEKLSTGYGTIEMIRKRVDGSVEDFPIMGNELINGDGVWCYQIPMNLDYVITDEYGNLVPTDNVEKGLPTRTSVRFRISLSDFESDSANNHLVKALVPHNPSNSSSVDYSFGTNTFKQEDSYRDLLWNNIYTVKSYIPRIQKTSNNLKTKKFSGIKAINKNGSNNPMPYNNMRVNITLMFLIQCAIIKWLIRFTALYNIFLGLIPDLVYGIKFKFKDMKLTFKKWLKKERTCAQIGDGFCPDLEGWYFTPGCYNDTQFDNAFKDAGGDEVDSTSTDSSDDGGQGICMTTNTDHLIQCIELNLALEYDVIQFDFYNDWINGTIYLPRWFADIRKKHTFLFGLFKKEAEVQACVEGNFNDRWITKETRFFSQQCAMGYEKDDKGLITKISTPNGCSDNYGQNCHKKKGRKSIKIFRNEKEQGIVHKHEITKNINEYGHKVYYMKPCEWFNNGKKCNFYATDIVLLGNINKCNIYGIPSDLEGLSTSTYQMPPSIVQTNMDSDGVLYGIKGQGGTSKCGGKEKVDGVEQLNQTFDSYNEWSKTQDLDKPDNGEVTEYAVTELVGIDWGLEGPNQGKSKNYELYNPGGHFLGISCTNAQVNIKSCVNLSRICELGVKMSQRQSKVVNIIEEDGNVLNFEYKYIIPTGIISKDEISENNFRNIFATLNYNNLKTFKNEKGFTEYDFIPLHMTNFNGDLKSKINKKTLFNSFKWDNETKDKGSSPNASAYTRTIEDSNEDYYYFRLGVDKRSGDDSEKLQKQCIQRFLYEDGNVYYLPVYENSFYFYFGLKDGLTALDKLQNDYYAKCPRKGVRIVPDFSVNFKNPVIPNDCNGSIQIVLENVSTPYGYTIYRNDILWSSSEEEYITELNFNEIAEEGRYEITVFNKLQGFNKTEVVTLTKVLPPNDEYNIYEGSCYIDAMNFIDEPLISKESEGKFKITPNENGGIITITTPKHDSSKLAPYIYGFIVTCNDNHAICKTYMNNNGINEGKNSYENTMKVVLQKETGIEYSYVDISNSKNVDYFEELNDVKDNAIYSFFDNDNMISTFKAWAENEVYTLFIFYGENKNINLNNPVLLKDNISTSNLVVENTPNRFGEVQKRKENPEVSVIEIGKVTPKIVLQSLTYYIYDETLTLSKLDKINDSYLITKSKINGDGVIKYDNLSKINPTDEWLFKKALYYTESYFDKGTGSINVGVIGGAPPYTEKIAGCGEVIDEKGDVILKGDMSTDNITGGSQYSIDLKNFRVPTKKWIGDDIPDKDSYVYEVYDANNSVPYILTKEAENNASNTMSGILLTSFFE